ncbi:MAG: tyrosine-protein kinase [Pseudomonas sp.]|uniref:polysaccharide biosynthesis tyrosine autokinase n=1 Tax=Pseudomonas sp. TaxID=306 RepID=UPI000CC2E466|nr:polysaccharide biosynthesis tyrosine autokinase [Pseudomonas sp.]PJI46798.1 MAG: tyrosine-protein kinase [Pseudomonas sp.]
MSVMPRSSLETLQDTRIDVAGLLRLLFDHKKMIIAVTGLFAVLGLFYAVVATPIYVSGAMIQIEQKKNGLNGTPEVINRPDSVSIASTEIELLKSRAVLGKAVEILKLDIVAKPRHLPLIGDYLARRYKPEAGQTLAAPWLGMGSYAWGGEQIKVFSLDVPEEYLGEPLTLVADGGEAYHLLNADDELILRGELKKPVMEKGFSIEVDELVGRPGTEFTLVKNRLLTTTLNYQKLLKVAEAGKDSGIIYMTLEDPNPQQADRILDKISHLYVLQNVERSSAEASQRLQFLRSQLPVVRLELEHAEAAYNAYQTTAKSADISVETRGVLDQVVGIDNQLSELKLKRAEYDRLYTPTHPTYQALLKQVGSLEDRKAQLQKRIQTLPATQQELLRLSRDMQVTRQTYTTLLNKAQEQDIIRAGTIGNVRVIDTAQANVEQPAKPMRKVIVLLATLLGFCVALGILFLRQAFYRGVENPEAIEQLGLSVLAAIPYSRQQERLEKERKGDLLGHTPKLLAASAPGDLANEAIRSLRTNLHFALLEARNNVVMLTSPAPGAGKSFVSSNLAAIVAQSGLRTLLIDADMRKGYLHRVFGLTPRHGLSDALSSHRPLSEVILPTEVPELDFISCGFAAPNPSELLMHDNFAQLLRDASSLYDLVIVDTPPVLAVTDAALVGRLCGICLLVTRFGQSPASEIDTARRRLAQSGIHLQGAILNGVKRKASTAAYDYGAYAYRYDAKD